MSKRCHISFNDSGDFLNWWFETERLRGKALQVFERYYSNYRKNFNGYLRQAWTDRHSELDKELEAIHGKGNIKIMDLGCGTGSVSLYVAGKLRDKCEVLGVDINEDRLFCARERQKVLEREIGFKLNCKYKKSNVLSLDEQDKVDLVYLEETLHHMEPRDEVVRKISNLIQDDGVLILSEVNAYNPLMQLYLLGKRGFGTVRRKVGENGQEFLYGVERIMTAKKAAMLFIGNGLRVKSLRYFRMASSKLVKLSDKMAIDFTDIEKKVCNIPFFAKFFSLHYNIVFKR